MRPALTAERRALRRGRKAKAQFTVGIRGARALERSIPVSR